MKGRIMLGLTKSYNRLPRGRRFGVFMVIAVIPFGIISFFNPLAGYVWLVSLVGIKALNI